MTPSRPHRRSTAFRRIKLTQLHASGNRIALPSAAFPGRGDPFEDERRGHLLASLGLALLVHAALLAAFVAMPGDSGRDAQPVKHIPVQLLKIPPAPLPAARAERSAEIHSPAPAPVPAAKPTRAPRTLNRVARSTTVTRPVEAAQPHALQRDAPERIALDDLPAPTAPRELDSISRGNVEALEVVAMDSARVEHGDPAASTAPETAVHETSEHMSASDIGAAPTDIDLAPAGAETSAAMNLDAAPEILAAGTPLAAGIVTRRNVVGFDDAPPLPELDTQSSDAIVLATGGLDATGDGTIGGEAGCLGHPEVQAYTRLIRDRVYPRLGARDVSQTTTVSGRIVLDPDGSLIDIQLIESGDPALGESAITAFHQAAPFPAMSSEVRCLADTPIRWNFRLHPVE